jgi:limonene-1,2-epoxide hydrolase
MKLNEVIDWYEHLSPERLGEIDRLYQETATFRDPFNHVSGQAAIENIFRHMFVTTEHPRFNVIDKASDANCAWLRWRFHFGLKGRSMAIEGASRLVFGEDGRVVDHRDYWDATDLFLQLPLLGTMVRLLKKRFSACVSNLGQESRKNER